jgi:hypothetical protein
LRRGEWIYVAANGYSTGASAAQQPSDGDPPRQKVLGHGLKSARHFGGEWDLRKRESEIFRAEAPNLRVVLHEYVDVAGYSHEQERAGD